MPRHVLAQADIHPAIRDKISTHHQVVVDEVQAAVAAKDVVVVGMATNPFVKKARNALSAAGVKHHYLEYGSYLTKWRERNAVKMWSGWPTFPMVFVRGVLVGGADDVQALISSGELQKLLGK